MATATAVSKHQPIPYIKIAKLYNEGKSYTVIAQKVNRFNEKADDPTKSVRAIVSRMLTEGYQNEDGKTVKLKRREGSRGTGTPKAAKTTKKAAKKAAKVAKTVQKGKAIAIMVTEDGKHVKITVPSLTTLVPIEKFEQKVQEVLAHKPTPSPEPAPTTEAPAAPTTEAVAQPEAMPTQTPEAAASVEEVEVAEMEEAPELDGGEEHAPAA